jgi:predicted porin
MKKSLIALAVVGAFSAPAFADTSVYGLLDGAIANVTGTNLKGQTLGVSGGLAPSRLGFNASEDLGGGMKAIVNLEYSIDGQSNTSLGGLGAGTACTAAQAAKVGGCPAAQAGNSAVNDGGVVARQQLLGLTGDFGTVAIGYLQSAALDFGRKYDPTAESAVSPLQNMGVGGGFLIGAVQGLSRAPRAVAYITPNMSGFTLSGAYSTAANPNAPLGNVGQASGTDINATAGLVSGFYETGALSVGLVYGEVSVPAGGNGQKEWALGGNYDFGMAKVFATYQENTQDNTPGDNKLYSISGVIPAGPGAIALSYAHANMGQNNASNDSGSSYTAAYLHSMSKTTTLYAAYNHTTQDNGTANFSTDNSAVANGNLTAGGNTSLFAIGLSKKF